MKKTIILFQLILAIFATEANGEQLTIVTDITPDAGIFMFIESSSGENIYPTKIQENKYIFNNLKADKYFLHVQPGSESSGNGDNILRSKIDLSNGNKTYKIHIPSGRAYLQISNFDKISEKYAEAGEDRVHLNIEKLGENHQAIKGFNHYEVLSKSDKWSTSLWYMEEGQYRICLFKKGNLEDKSKKNVHYLYFSVKKENLIYTSADNMQIKHNWEKLDDFKLTNLKFNNTSLEMAIQEINKKLDDFKYKLYASKRKLHYKPKTISIPEIKEISLRDFLQVLYLKDNIGNEIKDNRIILKTALPIIISLSQSKSPVLPKNVYDEVKE